MATSPDDPARELWKRIETLHAVTYFARASVDAAKEAGLRGFWMGYFAFRAAPLGAVGPGVVEAAFANFAPRMVQRAIPDAWSHAQPADLVSVRADAAAEVLRGLSPDLEAVATRVNRTLAGVVGAASPIGRPLFAANRDVAVRDDPVGQLWQLCTTLREHRGDGHVIALAAAGITGCEAHHLVIAAQDLPSAVFRENRGWTEEEWDDAERRLRARGLLDDGGLTASGRRVHDDVEGLTDALARAPIDATLSTGEFDELIDALTPPAVEVATSGVLPFPNPMGLPAISDTPQQT